MKYFLEQNEHLIFHTLEYKKFIEEAFNCQYKFISYAPQGKVKLVLPLVEVKSKIFGNKLVSSAYQEYGGFCGDKKYVNNMLRYLLRRYKKFDYLEVRGGFNEDYNFSFQQKNFYKRFILDLSKDVWKGIQKSKRKAVKKALKNVEVKNVPIYHMKEFYKLYCQNMRRFGSPCYPKKYFLSFYQNLVKNGLGKIYGAYYQGKLISALLGFTYQDRVHILIAVSNPKFQSLRGNDAVHWKFIEWAIENKFKWFDFGRVRTDSGQFEYKRKWGAELFELPSYFIPLSKDVDFVDPSGYGLLVRLWRLMPLFLTRLVGPKLRKELGI